MNYQFTREDVDFYSKGTRCSAWLYLPESDTPCPIIVMAHGLGGVREMWIDRHAEHFAAAGYACFLFDYRNWGASDGKKRQLINVKHQLVDWNNAIEFIKKDKRVDGNKLLIFGSSFSGGHAITLSVRRNDINSAVAQCPYTDQWATIKTIPPIRIIKFIPYLVGDLLSCLTGYHPVMLKLADPQGKAALMAEPDYDKFIARIPEKANFRNETPARTILEFLKYSPSRYTKHVEIPIYVAACLKDTLAPAYATIKCMKRAKNATIKEYNCGHFDIYFDEFFEEAIADYIDFFNRTVK